MFGYVKRVNGEDLVIGVEYNMPYRKKPCLVVMRGNAMVKYATFNNVYSAEEFMKIFQDFLYKNGSEVE